MEILHMKAAQCAGHKIAASEDHWSEKFRNAFVGKRFYYDFITHTVEIAMGYTYLYHTFLSDIKFVASKSEKNHTDLNIQNYKIFSA